MNSMTIKLSVLGVAIFAAAAVKAATVVVGLVAMFGTIGAVLILQPGALQSAYTEYYISEGNMDSPLIQEVVGAVRAKVISSGNADHPDYVGTSDESVLLSLFEATCDDEDAGPEFDQVKAEICTNL